MARYHYPASTLLPDYLRVAFGLAVTAGPLLALDLANVIAVLLGALALLFAWFGVRTVLRQLSWIELSPTGIALCGPIRRRLPWQQIRRLQLAYYAPRRARQDGWLQLTLRRHERRADPGRLRRSRASTTCCVRRPARRPSTGSRSIRPPRPISPRSASRRAAAS